MEPAPLPYATMLTFGRYIGRTGPAKATFVGSLRRARQGRVGFNPHAQFVKALKADIQFRTRGGSSALAAVVEAVQPRWRPLYQSLREGADQYLAALGDPAGIRLVPVRDAIDVVGGLSVKVNPDFGLRYADGRLEAVRLYFDPEPPSDDLVIAALHLMTRRMFTILPNGAPALVDLRRGTEHRPDPRTRHADVERWLAGEAMAFASMWGAEPRSA